ncbi:MAG: glutamine--tRNA ligase/YqeY domain fusion protein [Gammaproteobacteria bacterium]
MTTAPDDDATPRLDFIRQIIADDQAAGRHGGDVVTRFPPEPNGFLHVGHAKSICLNFGVAEEYGGRTFLRFDDTNPTREDESFARAIERDVRWLGFDWGERLTHASDYFERLYDDALRLIDAGVAYVDSLSAEQIREYRGTLTVPGRNSPDRDRSVDENRDLFTRMRAGEFADGQYVLRARIDMASPNINLRDPALYRIRHVSHQRTGDAWPIYPMYDYAHTLCDAYEGITHSLCTLEFEDHRPLYDWLLDQIKPERRPRQIEFSRLNLAYTITSKRKLSALVDERIVTGWNDPRMATLAGMRRRGYPPEAVRDFVHRGGVTKKYYVMEMGVLENSVRQTLGDTARRVMGVVNPLKITLTNYPEGQTETMTAQNHPGNPDMGERPIPFSRTLFVEREDFMEEAPRKFFRLKPGGEVRLRYAYIIQCNEVIKDVDGNVIELLCTYDESTRSGSANADRKVKGTIHWASAEHAVDATVNVYDRLFSEAAPGAAEDWHDALNDSSLTIAQAKLEPSLAELADGEVVQFERMGYFTLDTERESGSRVFHRVVSLRDSWAKMEKQALTKINEEKA